MPRYLQSIEQRDRLQKLVIRHRSQPLDSHCVQSEAFGQHRYLPWYVVKLRLTHEYTAPLVLS